MDWACVEQKTVKVDVAVYDDAEREKLLKYPSSEKILGIDHQIVEISMAEFLTYYLLHKKRTNKLGWSSVQELRGKVEKAYSDLEDFVVFNGQSIATAPDIINQVNHITEYIGESIGLSVVNRLHGLTYADWGRIPEQKGTGAKPVFDYELEPAGSDGSLIIQVENKGSSVKDNTIKGPSVYQHKSKIVDKKANSDTKAKRDNPESHFVRYGTITAVDPRQDSVVKCWLLDPDPDISGVDPMKFRLINRMRFIYEWISLLSPRSQLASALATRLAALEALENPFELDGIPLKKGNGDDFTYDPYFIFRDHSSWMTSKSKVVDGPAGGTVVQLSNGNLLFVGIREDLLTLATKQQFSNIFQYKADTGSLTKTIECVISKSRFDRFRLTDEIRQSADLIGGYFHFQMQGQIHYSPEGILFGILPIEPD